MTIHHDVVHCAKIEVGAVRGIALYEESSVESLAGIGHGLREMRHMSPEDMPTGKATGTRDSIASCLRFVKLFVQLQGPVTTIIYDNPLDTK